MVVATALSLSRVAAAPQAQSARKNRIRKLIVAIREGSGEYDAGGAAPVETKLNQPLRFR
jgi:hypothetical protein